MSTIIVYAKPCTFEERAGMRTFTWMLTAQAIATAAVDCKNVDQVEAAMQQLQQEVAASYPKSFFVSAMLKAGERAPRGFKNRNWKIEVDRCPGAEPIAA
jgi:hypothetical protein